MLTFTTGVARTSSGVTYFRERSTSRMLSSVEDPQTDLKTVKSFQSPLFPAEDSGPVERPLWSHYHKPIFVLVIGGLVLCTGVALSLVSSEKNSVPQVLGPVFLSIGLMFILVAVVWFPIIKDKLKRKGLKTPMESFDED